MLPKIIDLFSGCGGLALGFQKAGFDIAGGIELMPQACNTITTNLNWRFGKKETHICGDIREIDADVFKDRFNDEGCIVIGGPPCQAYSLVGRAKLKSLGEDRKNVNDARGYLYQDFLRFALDLNARAVIMENVPESTDFGGVNIPDTVCGILDDNGYDAYWTILNSADYGVPQIRERVFVLAVRRDEKKNIELPLPSFHSKEHQITNHQRMFDSYKKSRYFRMPIKSSDDTPVWHTVYDALSDLPELYPDCSIKYKLEKMNLGMKYRREPVNNYQKVMRNWYGAETQFVTANCFRKTIRDFPIFARMKQGDNYVDASRIADELFNESERVYNYPKGSESYKSLKKKIVPPYARDKFPEKWKRLDENKPSHTLVAHLSVDTYSHIHPREPRGISVREAARLQSFPDDFYFNCAMSDAFKQIGNAVPPLLAYGVAKTILKTFNQ